MPVLQKARSSRCYFPSNNKHVGLLLSFCLGWFSKSLLERLFDREAISTREGTPMKGWRTIDVFVGKTKSSSDSKQWYSQAHQDEIVYSLFRGKRNGVFVDLAANDATEWSNTLALEERLGWSGLCVEANPVYWSNLTLFRSCQVVGAVVGYQEMQPIYFNMDGAFGKIADYKQRPGLVERYTTTLDHLLDIYNIPQVDYLSLDVEGAEEFILRSSSAKIKVMTIERPSAALKQLLSERGYNKLARLSNFGETLWIHSSVKHQLDLSIVRKYNLQQQNN